MKQLHICILEDDGDTDLKDFMEKENLRAWNFQRPGSSQFKNLRENDSNASVLTTMIHLKHLDSHESEDDKIINQ